jgi:protein-tyrosine phosphatase
MAIFEKTVAENVVARPQRNPYANVQRWDSHGRGSAIVGMTRIWERLYLGSLRDAAQLAAENPFGIDSVLSLCSQKVPYRASRIRYTRLPIAESRPISARQFDAVMGEISEAIRNGNLLIHCVAGINRSPVMTAAWLHRCGFLNLVAALVEIDRLRPMINPSPVLLRSVAEHLRR